MEANVAAGPSRTTQRLPLEHDLVGGPFAVIESDPGVFTSLLQKLGICGLEFTELYDLEQLAGLGPAEPRGLILCLPYGRDVAPVVGEGFADDIDSAAQDMWFVNQLADDACASLALLNVVLNSTDVRLGDGLEEFRAETSEMSPVIRGLAVTNCQWIREAHNSLARPADVRAAYNKLALEAKKPKSAVPKKTPRKGVTTFSSKSQSPKKKKKLDDSAAEVYHYIGYIPSHGKVWELDGYRHGPLEVGELSTSDGVHYNNWMNVARPAVRARMAAAGGTDARCTLLALVDGAYERASDAFELYKRERAALERRLAADPSISLDPETFLSAEDAFATTARPSSASGPTYAQDFGSRKMARDVAILDMHASDVPAAWEACARNARRVKATVEEELAHASVYNTEHVKRTHDYEPFITGFITRMHQEGLLLPLLQQQPHDALGKNSTSTPAKKLRKK